MAAVYASLNLSVLLSCTAWSYPFYRFFREPKEKFHDLKNSSKKTLSGVSLYWRTDSNVLQKQSANKFSHHCDPCTPFLRARALASSEWIVVYKLKQIKSLNCSLFCNKAHQEVPRALKKSRLWLVTPFCTRLQAGGVSVFLRTLASSRRQEVGESRR